MIRLFPAIEDPAPVMANRALSLDAVHARITSLDPALERGTPAHAAALILLAASSMGQNVDRLARFTGLGRELVARCARRLVDNGVWQDGNTIGRWLDQPEDTDSFWADVAVAEGRQCRRVGDDGAQEWAPQGYWRKHFEYVGPRGEEQPQVVSYLPHVEPTAGDLPYIGDDEYEEEAEASAVRVTDWAVQTVPEDLGTSPAPTWLGGEIASGVDDAAWSPTLESEGEKLFPDAVWLG